MNVGIPEAAIHLSVLEATSPLSPYHLIVLPLRFTILYREYHSRLEFNLSFTKFSTSKQLA